MNASIQAYIDITKRMLVLLKDSKSDESREERINQVTDLLADRDQYQEQIHPPFSETDQQLGKHAIALDQQLQQNLTQMMQQIKQDMRNTKKQTRSNHHYLNPYKNVANFDGRFLDSKQ